METGYISGRKGMYGSEMITWTTSKGAFVSEAEREELVTAEHWWEGIGYAKAFRCRNCRLIQFDY